MSRGADVYYGEVADNYDASRNPKQKRKAEITAVAELLTTGPVLDVPVGTGVFVPIYRAKGFAFTGYDISPDMLKIAKAKYPGIDVHLGDIFNLPAGGNYGTAVCVRLLEWLPLDQAKRVIHSLANQAVSLIVSINHGLEGCPEAYTYDLAKFLSAIDGLLIEARRVTATIPNITSEIFKLRPATWADVVAQFRHDHGDAAEANIQRIADKFAGFFDLPPIPIHQHSVSVRAEYWSTEQIRAVVNQLAPHRFITKAEPRRTDLPATVIVRDGVSLMIDGRARANRWIAERGPHPVLVLKP